MPLFTMELVVPLIPELDASAILEGCTSGAVKLLYIAGENPIVSYPDKTKTEKALAAASFVVVQDLFLTETASALRRKVVEESIEPTAASDSVAFFLDVVRTGSLRLAEDELLVDKALRLSLLLGHKLPDCVYLALAEREGIALATADQALARLAASRGVPVRLVPST